jgi:4-deoxy-L-threo-5-hexosulose-uronate ketol-isomerase
MPNTTGTNQLVVGMTALEPGSVWNTMPCHVHTRRMEAYLYFNLDPAHRVFHFMGEPQTRPAISLVANEEAVLAPNWSIHCGCRHLELRLRLGHGRRQCRVHRHGPGARGYDLR